MLALRLEEEQKLWADIQRAMYRLGDAWNPGAGVETTVLNALLKDCAQIRDRMVVLEPKP